VAGPDLVVIISTRADGTEWKCYDLVEGRLRQVDEIVLEDTSADIARLWIQLGFR
jgi:hypothetical protein